VNLPGTVPTPALAADPDFAANVLHDLSQPLTALHCALELALLQDQTIEEFRASVEAALRAADRLRQQLLLLRELHDADDPSDTSTPLALDQLLQQLREEMLPLFESAARSFDLTCDSVRVPANDAKLERGFFYLFEFLLRDSPDQALIVRGERTSPQQIEIRIAGCGASANSGPSDDCSQPDWSGELEIARRTFRAIGGDLVWMSPGGLSSTWIVQLPTVD
jgi:hypothetical protein